MLLSNLNSKWNSGFSVLNRHVSLIGVRKESNLASLRKKTGFALKLCKKALELNEQNLSKAETWLKQEAIKHGWEKSVQLQNRVTAQGLVGVLVDNSNRTGFLVEVNCETDFVARNNIFRNLVAEVTQNVATTPRIKSLDSNATDAKAAGIIKYEINDFNLETFKDKISSTVTQLGENIKLNRATIIVNENHDNDSVRMFGYTHAGSGENIKIGDVQMGKYGTIIALKQLPEVNNLKTLKEETRSKTDSTSSSTSDDTSDSASDSEDDLGNEQEIVKLSADEVAKVLNLQIISMRPKCLTLSEDELVAEQKERSGDEDIESVALLHQKLLINSRMTVKDYLKFQNLEVIDFVRYECGESSTV